jgi:translation initiation factor 2 beta subunit (eIF-2beta)/eIF-5
MADPAIVFDHKEILMAQVAGSKMINLTNYEEFFLMYADNELSTEERAAVEKFSSQHPKLRKELSYILKCRISPDLHIVFEGKESLFRHESKERTVYFSQFNINIVVAASLLLIAGFLLFKFIFTERPAPAETARQIAASHKNVVPEKKLTPIVTPGTVTTYNESTAKLQEVPDRKLAENLTRSSLKKKQDRDMITAVEHSDSDIALSRQSIAVAIISGTRANPNTSDISSMIEKTGKPVIALNTEQIQNVSDIDQSSDVKPGQQVVMTGVINTEDGISVLTGTPSKNAMRGFFRKVSRVFEKTTRIGDEDEKKGVLIGNFQIALK